MKAISKVIRAPLKLLGLIPKTPDIPEPPKPVGRDEAREEADKRAELGRRQGATADIVTGSSGAEAGRTGASRLG